MFVVTIVALIFSTFTLSNGLLLDCTYSVRSHWTVINTYQCTGRIVFIGDPRNVSNVSHNHIGERNNSDVLGIFIDSQILGFLPRNIDEFFPNLESLAFRSTAIESLHPSELRVFPNLMQIDFFFNAISQLDFHFFQDNLKLRAISFSSNPLNHVGHGVFDVLDELTSLNTQGTCNSLNVNSNRQLVVNGIFNFARLCPPTFQMMETELLTGRNFERTVDQQIADRMNPLTMQVFQLRQELIELENRIAELEERN
ncbi:CLUMA_CG016588, isoform A [Clunio marinus]|uniref:CLUMA_CG016588, isoform A n=1 Tax=Clunio marinus TaxID=568069 RepID=A0A1J1ISL2_9DIPT|nr:CLUMA_CG016588, isoform A [Clunio marinus]